MSALLKVFEQAESLFSQSKTTPAERAQAVIASGNNAELRALGRSLSRNASAYFPDTPSVTAWRVSHIAPLLDVAEALAASTSDRDRQNALAFARAAGTSAYSREGFFKPYAPNEHSHRAAEIVLSTLASANERDSAHAAQDACLWSFENSAQAQRAAREWQNLILAAPDDQLFEEGVLDAAACAANLGNATLANAAQELKDGHGVKDKPVTPGLLQRVFGRKLAA